MNEKVTVAVADTFGPFTFTVSFSVPGSGFIALFGPSGSGKTTVLRCMAGLERAVKGYISVNGEVWQDESAARFVPPHKRNIGYVFQEANLFTHLTVLLNLKYGYKRIHPDRRVFDFEEVVDLLGIGRLLHRDTRMLSGGERQRVAIGRALLAGPKLLLMDEPLAALDNKSKSEIMPYFEKLKSDLQIPVMYVSHSLPEVTRLADHLVIIDAGVTTFCGEYSDTVSDKILLPPADTPSRPAGTGPAFPSIR